MQLTQAAQLDRELLRAQQAMPENTLYFWDTSYKEQPRSNYGSRTQQGKKYRLQCCSLPRSSYYIWTASQRPPAHPLTINTQFRAFKSLKMPLCRLFCKVILNEGISKALGWKRISLSMLIRTVLLSIANKLHESQLLPGHKRAPRKKEKIQYILILIQFQRLE